MLKCSVPVENSINWADRLRKDPKPFQTSRFAQGSKHVLSSQLSLVGYLFPGPLAAWSDAGKHSWWSACGQMLGLVEAQWHQTRLHLLHRPDSRVAKRYLSVNFSMATQKIWAMLLYGQLLRRGALRGLSTLAADPHCTNTELKNCSAVAYA